MGKIVDEKLCISHAARAVDRAFRGGYASKQKSEDCSPKSRAVEEQNHRAAEATSDVGKFVKSSDDTTRKKAATVNDSSGTHFATDKGGKGSSLGRKLSGLVFKTKSSSP